MEINFSRSDPLKSSLFFSPGGYGSVHYWSSSLQESFREAEIPTFHPQINAIRSINLDDQPMKNEIGVNLNPRGITTPRICYLSEDLLLKYGYTTCFSLSSEIASSPLWFLVNCYWLNWCVILQFSFANYFHTYLFRLIMASNRVIKINPMHIDLLEYPPLPKWVLGVLLSF